MPGHGSQISRKQETAIAALLTQGTASQAAEEAKIPYRTLKRWLTEPSFVQAYRAERRRLVEHAVGRMQRATQFAVTALLVLLKDGNDAMKFNAAKLLIENSRDAIDKDEVLERLEALEACLFAPSATPSMNGVGKR